jgi:thioredoxin-like negative regulator of GroEL
MAEVEISVFIVDNSRKLLMSQETFVKRGVGDNENKAVMEAVKALNARDSKLKKMITIGKNRIVEYYNTECETVVKTINTYLECGMVEEALNELHAIPQIDENTGCYDNSLNILSKISQEQQNAANDKIKNENPDVSWINE